MRKLILFLFAAVVVAGCTITERVVFDSKNGGNISYEIDATEFVGFMNMADSSGKKFSLGDSLDELKKTTESLRKIQGIHNVKFEGADTKVTFSFDFDSPDALNRAHTELGINTQNEGTRDYKKLVIKNKKEWIYRTWPLGESAKDSVYETMGMMLTYKLEAIFPKSINSTDAKTATISNNKLTWTSSPEDNGAAYAFDGIKVKLK